MTLSTSDKTQFILANTKISSPPHVPEIKLHLADEAHDLWEKTEEELNEIGLPPPFWAFAWAGGQGLARYILDNPSLVAGKNILDFASGSGLVAIAAKMSGANKVVANDIDPFCSSAIKLNSDLNGRKFETSTENLLNHETPHLVDFDVILAGDVFYDQQMVLEHWPVLQSAAMQGVTVLVGDPGRSYLPKTGLEFLIDYKVPVTRVLEDSDVKHTSVWKVSS